MYKFYRDKTEEFKGSIGLEGANLSKAKARLVLESDEYNLLFPGTIDKSGKFSISIPKLKILSEDLKGNLKLEVIVEDDSIFIPYEDKFEIGTSRKVTVEVAKQDKPVVSEGKKKVTAVVETKKIEEKPKLQVVEAIYKIFEKRNITIHNIKGHKEVPMIISEVLKKFKINKNQINIIQEQLLEKLITKL